MNKDIAISVKNVYKDFKLPHEKITSVKSAFTGLLKGRSHLRYEQQHALKDISFDIKKGEFFGIVGRNGSGKSTLLKIIAQIYQPTKGSVRVNGKLVPFIELGVGFNPELTGRENVYLNGAILGFSKEKIDENYKNIVEFAELEEFMDQKLKNYSSGMQVRLAFACATKAEADVLLVDEVLAVGDSEFQKKCFNFFKKLKHDRKTVVFVSHDMNAIREYCDRAVLIESSILLAAGKADRIAAEYSKLFLKDGFSNIKGAGSRWGNGILKISNPKIIERDNKLSIEFSVKSDEDIENLSLGYYLRSEQGLMVCGSNTKILEKKTDLKAGIKYGCTFSVDNILSDGLYYLTLAAVERSGLETYDWWEDSLRITITTKEHIPYIVNPSTHFALTGEKND